MKISVGIITRNEERRIEKTLIAAKKIADEIVVVDSGSTDKTIEILNKYNCKVFSEEWKGFGMQKNSVIDKCSGEWILLIDADEEISEKLQKKLIEIKNSKESKKLYSVNFISVCFGKRIRFGGWSNLYRVRFFKKSVGRYNANEVHEDFITNEKPEKIKEPIYHYSYLTIEDYFNKFNNYTTLAALEMKKRGKKAGAFKIITNTLFKFIKMYIIRLGFLDGLEGLLLAVFSSVYNLVKYAKLRELNK